MSAKLSERDFVASIEARKDIRFFLVFGPDESAASAIAAAMVARLGADSEAVDIDSGRLRGDPALLADEAASRSLFGSARHIRLAFAREEGVEAVENLLSAEQAGNPVIATAGDLKKTSKLRKLAEGSPLALTYICYAPTEAEATDQLLGAAQAHGLRLDRTIAAQIVRYTGQDRRLAAMELEKLSLYYDAAPDRPATVEPAALTALSAETVEEDVSALVNQVMGGEVRALGREIIEARALGLDAIRIIRALQRRVALLAGMRAKVDNGGQAGAVVRGTRGIFWKEQDAYVRQLGRWPSARLAGLNSHLLELEAKLMSVGADMGVTVLEQELTRISRAAARAR
jgi:DNA polymerase III subunit delta